jgi:hypothetical protein
MVRSILGRAGVVAGAAAVVLCAGTAQAGPLRPELVAPEATWLVHVDVEGIIASALGREIMAHHEGHGDVQDVIAEIHGELGLDPTKDVKSVTAFGVDADDEEAVVLIDATEAVDQAMKKLPEQPGYKTIVEGQQTIHSWTEGDDTQYVYVGPGAGAGDRLVLVSQDLEQVKSSMMRLIARGNGGKAVAALAGGGPKAGSLLFVSAGDLAALGDHGHEEASEIIKYAKSLRVDVGETAGKLFVDGVLVTPDAEAANNMSQVVAGLMALGRMAAAGEPQAKPALGLFDALKFQAEGASVKFQFSYDVQALLQTLSALDDDGDDDADDDAGQAQGAAAKDGEHHEHVVKKSVKVKSKSESAKDVD